MATDVILNDPDLELVGDTITLNTPTPGGAITINTPGGAITLNTPGGTISLNTSGGAITLNAPNGLIILNTAPPGWSGPAGDVQFTFFHPDQLDSDGNPRAPGFIETVFLGEVLSTLRDDVNALKDRVAKLESK